LVILHMFKGKLDLYLLMLQVKLSKSTTNDLSLTLEVSSFTRYFVQ